MKTVGILSTAVLSLTLGIAAPAYAQQEQHDQQQEQKDKPAQQKEKHGQPETKKAPSDEHRSQPAKQQAQKEEPQPGKPSQRENQHANDAKPAQQNEHHAKQDNQPAKHDNQNAHLQHGKDEHAQRTPEQQHVRQTAWQEHRSQNWQSDHRTWQQRGGYHGYRIPDDHFRGYFGPDHGFRIYSLPFLVVGGYPRFQYGGYWISAVDPWPGYWAADWYDTDDVYIVYVDNGYYMYNRRYPTVGIAINISL